MRATNPWLAISFLTLSLGACKSVEKDFNRPLPPGAPALLVVEDPADWPDMKGDWHAREELLPALERSLKWTDTKQAQKFFPIEGVSHSRALASLQRFRELLLESRSPEEFERALKEEFTLYQSAGWDGRGGGVLYTAYCTPIMPGSLTQDAQHRFPLYAQPDDLEKGERGEILGRATNAGLEPYPARAAIEASGMLNGRGLELVWLKSPLDAFIAHVNGSAFVRLADGTMARFGYAATNGREYTSLGKELIADGRLEAERTNLASIREWARAHPEEVDEYLARNERYVFFTSISGNPRGSLNVEVSAERSLATDKALFPRGAVVFVDTHIPGAKWTDGKEFHQFMLDQDTGGAIRTAGRADIYLGVGDAAEELAGSQRVEGQLYYFFLRG
jgi:membrane-bound lytic murein transglycosylase A